MAELARTLPEHCLRCWWAHKLLGRACVDHRFMSLVEENMALRRRLALQEEVSAHVYEMREMLRLALHHWSKAGVSDLIDYNRCRRALRE